MEPLIKLFESKARRIIFAVILVIILAAVISDSLDGIVDSMLTAPLTALGCGGGGVFLGVGLLCVLPDAPPQMRQGGYVFAILLTVGGTVFLLLFVISLVRMISSLF